VTQARIDPGRFDTLLLDMDGTLLDLAFDNYFWRELVPRAMAHRSNCDLETAREVLFRKYTTVSGTLDWYCIDYWTRELDLDIRALKSAASHRIRVIPGARKFLDRARAEFSTVVLVTNAHDDAFSIKSQITGLEAYFDVCITSHAIGAAKEHPDFWTGLVRRLDFDPEKALLVDDSHAVLDAAEAFGIGGLLAIARPDSGREREGHPRLTSVDTIADLKWQREESPAAAADIESTPSRLAPRP
jgi:putative hydrolase of the HAD superfamily